LLVDLFKQFFGFRCVTIHVPLIGLLRGLNPPGKVMGRLNAALKHRSTRNANFRKQVLESELSSAIALLPTE
jgi:hypothetical protein